MLEAFTAVTAGTFRLGFLRVVEGERFSVPINMYPNYGRQIFYRLSGNISKSDVRGSRLSGVVKVGKNLKASIPFEFVDDGRKETSEKVGIALSTDKTFQDTTRQFNYPGRNPLFFDVLDVPSVKRDLITGIQNPSGNLGPKGGALGLVSTTSSSEFGTYYAEFKPDLSEISIFADSNRNGEYDKKDAFLDAFKITSFVDLGEFGEGVPRTFEYRQNTGEFLLKYGGRTYLEASGGTDLF